MNLLIPLGCFLTATLLTRLYIAIAIKLDILDKPNARSSHVRTTPRGGGVVFALLWFIVLYWQKPQTPLLIKTWVLVASLGTVTLVGFIDDYYSLSARLRFACQVFSAVIFLLGIHHLPPLPFLGTHPHYWFNALSFVLLIIGIVWSTNLYNFMDGLDGLAASEGLFLLGMGALLFYLQGAYGLSQLLFSAFALVAGFLTFNWPQARIFMGDAGSYFLGFLVAALSILGVEQANISLEIWLILYSLFWFDATLTLLRRAIKGRVWSQAHREHAFQRLHLAGWSHRQVLMGVIITNTLLGVLALYAYLSHHHHGALLMAVSLVGGIYYKIEQINPHD